MGVFEKLSDQLKRIRFGGARVPFEATADPLVLEGDPAGWPPRAAAHFGLDEEFARFGDQIMTLVEDVTKAIEPLESEDTIKRLPERARTVNQIHASELAQKAKKVLATVRFQDLYHFDDDHQAFLQAIALFRDSSSRNTAALHEHLGDQVEALTITLQRLEDETIRFAQLLEERHYPHLKRLKEAHHELVAHDERREKAQALATALTKDQERTNERVSTLEAGTREDEEKIRNEDARQALARLVELEEELERLVGPLQQAAHDALTYYRKYSAIIPPLGSRQVLDDVDRDAARTLAADADRVTDALERVSQQIAEESKPNTKPLASKLERIAHKAESVAQRAGAILPEQVALRQRIMRDVAALSAYDKRQFLLAARREGATIAAKLAFLEQELAPEKRIAHERAVKDAALALGAMIPGEVPPTPATPEPNDDAHDAAAEEPVDEDPEQEIVKAEETLEHAKELLEGGKKAKHRKGKR